MKIFGYIVIMVICIFSVILVGYAGWMTFYPFKVIDIKNNQDLPINKKTYQAGESIHITFDYYKFMDIALTVKKEIVCDGSITTLLYEPRRLPLGRGVTILDHTIPISTPTDKHCRIYIFLEYHPTKLKTISMTLRTSEFSVINKKL